MKLNGSFRNTAELSGDTVSFAGSGVCEVTNQRRLSFVVFVYLVFFFAVFGGTFCFDVRLHSLSGKFWFEVCAVHL